jgi:hypothetical protein
MFAPGEEDAAPPTQIGTTIPDDELIRIIEYLDTISNQVSQLVAPKLEILGIDVNKLRQAIDVVREEVNHRLVSTSSPSEPTEEEKEEEARGEPEEWRRLDWGGRRR